MGTRGAAVSRARRGYLRVVSAPLLRTARLTLRPPNLDDLDGWYAFVRDETAMTHLGGETLSRHEAWRQLCTMAGSWQVQGYGMFSVIETATGEWVGRIGPWQPADWAGPEVGWGLRTAFAGRGYAYEAAAASMDYVVDVLGWPRIIHTIVPENTRSIALARRLGSTNHGPTRLPPPLQDVPVDSWEQTAAQWRARRSAAGAAGAAS